MAKRVEPLASELSEDDPVHRKYLSGQQCESCRRYVALSGAVGMDWGVCTSKDSPCDGKVVFEHHSCLAFEAIGRRSPKAAAK